MKRMPGLPAATDPVAVHRDMAPAAERDPAPLFRLEGAFHSAATRGDYLYLAATDSPPGEPDIRIFRIGGKSGAEQTGEITANAGAQGIALDRNHLYLAQGDHGLEIIDLGTPPNPRSLAALPLAGYSHEVVVTGTLALVAAGFHGLHLVDISRPHRPGLLSSIHAYAPPQQAPSRELAETDDYGGLFSAQGVEPDEGGMAFSNPPDGYFDADDLPAFQDIDAGEITPEMIRDREGALDVVSDGRHAYVAYGSAGVFLVDISDPRHPRRAGAFPTHRPAERLALRAGRLFITTGVGGVLITDVSNPGRPRLLNTLRTTCYPMDVAAGGNGRTYIADGYCGSDGLLVFDMRNPRQPKRERSFSGGAGRVQLLDGLLVAMGKSGTRGYPMTP